MKSVYILYPKSEFEALSQEYQNEIINASLSLNIGGFSLYVIEEIESYLIEVRRDFAVSIHNIASKTWYSQEEMAKILEVLNVEP